LRFNGNTVQKVAGTPWMPSADSQKAWLFEGCGTWNVPTSFLILKSRVTLEKIGGWTQLLTNENRRNDVKFRIEGQPGEKH